ENDPVGTGKDLSAQNIYPDRAERTADFAEKTGPVPSADFAGGVAAVRFIMPGEDRFEGLFFLGQLVVHETMGQRQIGHDFLQRMNLKVTRRQAAEMSVDFVRAETAHRSEEHTSELQ